MKRGFGIDLLLLAGEPEYGLSFQILIEKVDKHTRTFADRSALYPHFGAALLVNCRARC